MHIPGIVGRVYTDMNGVEVLYWYEGKTPHSANFPTRAEALAVARAKWPHATERDDEKSSNGDVIFVV